MEGTNTTHNVLVLRQDSLRSTNLIVFMADLSSAICLQLYFCQMWAYILTVLPCHLLPTDINDTLIIFNRFWSADHFVALGFFTEQTAVNLSTFASQILNPSADILVVSSLLLLSWSRIHERTILLRFLGITLRVLRLEVSVNNVYITNQFQPTFAQGGQGGKIRSRGDRKTLKTFVPITSKNSASVV